MSPIALEKEDHVRDAAFNKAMHGKSAHAEGGLRAMFQKDKSAQQAAVDEYFKHWDNKAAADETEDTRKVCYIPLDWETQALKLRPAGETR
jgi:sterol 24-C-methyltransferase